MAELPEAPNFLKEDTSFIRIISALDEKLNSHKIALNVSKIQHQYCIH
jgi:hypothetical protein